MRKVDPSKIHRFFYPGVPAVLCASHRGRVSAMPVISCAALSEVPSLVGVSCNPQAFTYLLVSRSRLFSLCFLDRSRTWVIEFLATHSGRDSQNKLTDAGLAHRKGRMLDVPVIQDAAAFLECTLWAEKKFGDHVLIVGKVEAARASEDFKDYWRFKTYHPILYAGWRGRLTTFGA